MRSKSWKRCSGITVALLLVLAGIYCGEGGDVATGTDRLILSADPQQIGINGSTTLTVTGTDQNGAPLPDGTLVIFSVDKSGRVSPASIRLENGTGTSEYLATSSPGEITITATSGSVEARTTITVADDILKKVFVSANPSTFPSGGGTSVISAVVTDGSGRQLSGVDVLFDTDEGTLQSGGAPTPTNSNGLSTDVLNTSKSATVTATTDDGFSGETTVLVGVGEIVCHMSVSDATPSVGESVSFFDISDNPGNQIVRYQWSFGDGTSADGQNVQHTYTTEGSFDVVHSVTDARDNTSVCDPVTIEVSQ